MKALSLRAASILILLFIWWLAATLIHDPEILPGPLAVARDIASILSSPGPEGESAWFDIGITLARIVVAFFVAMLAGIGLGLAMGLNRGFDRWMQAIIPALLTLLFLRARWTRAAALAVAFAFLVLALLFVHRWLRARRSRDPYDRAYR